MENKTIGTMLIAVCLVLGLLIFAFNNELNTQAEASCDCAEMQESGVCSMENQTPWQTYLGIILVSGIAALGIYLIFFEKSQKEIAKILEKQKHIQIKEEKFEILLKGLDDDEKKIIKAVREQDGITQQTLRLQIDIHKSKLSILLDRVEKKELIARKEKGKKKQVFLKIAL